MKTVVRRVTYVCVNLMVIYLILTGQSFAQIDRETIVGIWLFDEGSGKAARDFSGKGNSGGLMNNPEWVEGKFGKALKFDGKDDYVEISLPSVFK